MKIGDKLILFNKNFIVTQSFSYDMSWEASCNEYLDLNKIKKIIQDDIKENDFHILEAWNKIENDEHKLTEKTYLIICQNDVDRQTYFIKQRREDGFDNSEIWNLESKILDFLIPRFKKLKNTSGGWPDGNGGYIPDEYILDDIITGFEIMKNQNNNDELKIRKAWRLLERYFFDLWN